MKRYRKRSFVLLSLLFLLSSATLLYPDQPPQGHTGATGVYCTECHTTNPLNNPGGSVFVTGLPDNSYTPGSVYDFSITIDHSTANRKRWGFSIIAVNSEGQPVGSFSSTNPNADLNGDELSHLNAIIFPTQQKSYTYSDLSWTAPPNPSAADQNITFYFAGNAANGNDANTGDYIYAGTKNISFTISQTYTFTGNGNWDNPANWSNNTIPPSSISGNATIIIDPPAGSECVLNVVLQINSGASLIIKEGKSFRVTGDLKINN